MPERLRHFMALIMAFFENKMAKNDFKLFKQNHLS